MASLGQFLAGLKTDTQSLGQFLNNKVVQPIASNPVASTALLGAASPQGLGAIRDMAQSFPRGLVAAGGSIVQGLGGNVPNTLPPPTSPVGQAIFGHQPINLLSGAIAQNAPSLQRYGLPSGVAKVGAGLGFLAGTVGQAYQGATEPGELALKDIAAANTKAAVAPLVEKLGLHPDIAAQYLPEFQAAKTPEAVTQVMSKAHQATDVLQHLTGADQASPSAANEMTPPALPQPRQFGETVKQSAQTSPEVAAQVGEHYVPRSNQELIQTVQQKLAADPANAHTYALQNSDEGTVAATLLAKHYESQGDFASAASLANDKMRRLTEAGREVQAASIWDKLSPETIGNLAAKNIQDYNATARTKIPELTPEAYQGLVGQAHDLQALPEGPAKQAASQQLLQSVHNLVPASVGDKVFALWRTGLLTGPQTIGKIALGHGVMSPSELVSQGIGGAIDKGMSLVTGQRGLMASNRGFGEGLVNGVQGAANNLIHGVQDPNLSPNEFHPQLNFGSSPGGKLAQGYVDTIGRLHGSIYQPFYGAHLQNSLYNQAQALAETHGLQGPEAESMIQHFVHDPSSQAVEIAHRDASAATFQQKTTAGDIASAVQQKGGPLGKALLPFAKVPGAVVTDLVNYSPVGVVKSAIEAVQRGEFTADSQRQLAQGLGRSITGTGAMAIGAALYNKGMMSLGYPLTDKKQQALDQLQGKTANSVLIDGKWRALNSLGPLGDALAVGGNFAQGLAHGVKSTKTGAGLGAAAEQGAFGGLSTIANSPFLQGLNNFNQAMNNPTQYATKVGEGFAKSVIPTVVGKVAQATDPLQREVNSIPEAVKSMIPGVRESLTPKTDVLGQTVPRANSPVGSVVDPFYSSTNRTSPVLSELQRLQDSGNPAIPDALTKNISSGGTKLTLDPQALSTLNQASGGQIGQAFTQAMNDPNYASLSDADKAKLLTNITSDIRTNAKNQTVNGQPLTSPTVATSGATTPGVITLPDGKLKYQQGSVTKTYDPSTYDQTYNGFKTLMDNKTLPDALKQAVIGSDPNAQAYQQRLTLETQLPLQQAQTALALERYKTSNNVSGWLGAATQQAQTLQQYLGTINQQSDPTTYARTQLQLDNLQTQMSKYQAQGGFTKGRSGSRGGSGKRLTVHAPSLLQGLHRPPSLRRMPSVPRGKIRAPKAAHVQVIHPPKSKAKNA